MQKQPEWKNKMGEIFQVCSDEFKRTTLIGKRMLNASKANTDLHESYEELGKLAYKALKKDELNWDHPRVKPLMEEISKCKSKLEDIEEEVNNIKFSDENIKEDSTSKTSKKK
mgnify:CR=1 FL=1